MTLVKMPEPVYTYFNMENDSIELFSASQMESYAQARVNEALERAAEKIKRSPLRKIDSFCGATADTCAVAVLACKQ